ncbi:hypothetical protein DFJ74DRAFT_764141 [Hyaloraphidium curvatum]|nr:hypothetical protein DFJ74DRAFT_764141 [Hyaloraphidium curvatum]
MILRWVKATKEADEGRLFVLGHSWGGQVVVEFLRTVAQHGQSDQLRESAQLSSGGKGFASRVSISGAVVCNSPLDERSYAAKRRALHEALDAETRRAYEAMELQDLEDASEAGKLAYRTLIGENERTITGAMITWFVLDANGKLDKRLDVSIDQLLPDWTGSAQS